MYYPAGLGEQPPFKLISVFMGIYRWFCLQTMICATFQRAWNVFPHRRKNAVVCFWGDVWFWRMSFGCLAFGWHSLTSPIHRAMHRMSLGTGHIIQYMPTAHVGHQTRKALYSHWYCPSFLLILLKSSNKEIREVLFWTFVRSEVEMYYDPMNGVQWQTLN